MLYACKECGHWTYVSVLKHLCYALIAAWAAMPAPIRPIELPLPACHGLMTQVQPTDHIFIMANK
jgi:hypothetical protein